MNKSTKQCPKCGNDDLVKLSSLNMKVCNVCHTEIKWSLDEGQPPLNGSNRQQTRKVESSKG